MATKAVPEVLILGAGAAGLSCAWELKRAGVRFLLLEARSRVGGRVLTHRPSHFHVPIELGAEFMHGASPILLEFMRQFHLPFCDVIDRHLYLKGRGLKPVPDFFEHLNLLMPRHTPRPGRDQSVRSYLKKKRVSVQWRSLFQGFVEGFHAADLDLMGVAGLAQTKETNESALNGVEMFRPQPGYAQLFQELSHGLAPEEIIFNTPVHHVHWSRGQVEATGRSQVTGAEVQFRAKRLVCALPIGVLQHPRAGLEWSPMPPALREALAAMEMGHVQRLVFEFRDRFWENLKQEQPIVFMHADVRLPFPTWWTLMPLRTPHLVAWQGGPRAWEMSSWTREQKTQVAFETLSRLTRRSVDELAKSCIAVHHHDWSSDPYTLGAYSYLRAGGLEIARRLAQPIAGTLHFAGEGLCFDATRGTVHGAMESGRRVARLICKSRN